jgi:3-phosphoinositide dependent protein kinase-1
MQKEKEEYIRRVSDRHPLENKLKKPSIDDFICICQLGRGSYGEVVLGKQKNNDQEYAIKIIDKRFMSREKKQY